MDKTSRSRSPSKFDQSVASSVFDRLVGDFTRRSASKKVKEIINEHLSSSMKSPLVGKDYNLSITSYKSNQK